MNLDEYTNGGNLLYEELADTVATILKAALKRSAPDLRVQEIQRRAKKPASLRIKLENKEDAPIDVAEAVIDLAGCRIIFYSNSHLDLFLKSQIIQNNFDVVRAKAHHPRSDEAESVDLFQSLNFVVKLSSPRVDLPEHAHLKDLQCEIQVQTLLNHAWAETGHDTIYKRPDLKGFGTRQMKAIEDRMTKIMRDFLLPAGQEFDKVARDFDLLAKGKALFDSNPLTALAGSSDNNERHDVLSRFLDTVLPLYDTLDVVHDEIRKAVVLAIKAGRETPLKHIESPYGKLPGRTSEAVTEVALGVLDELRYLDEAGTRAAWRALVDIYPGATTDNERKLVLTSVHRLAENNLEVWVQTDRPVVQEIVVAELTTLDDHDLVALRPLVLMALGSMLNPIAESVRREGGNAQFRRAHIPYSKELEAIRSQAIQLLKKLLLASTNNAERSEVIKHLAPASAMSHLGASPEGIALIARETATVYDIYTEFASILSPALRQHLEHEALIDYEHYIKPADGNFPCPDGEVRAGLEASLMNFRDTLNRDSEFVTYKVLMGYESVFPPSWTDPEFEMEGADEYRAQERRKYIDGITGENAAKWHDFVVACAIVDTNDVAAFPPLQDFLEELGAAKPAIALTYLREAHPALERFLPSLMKGIQKGGRPTDLMDIINRWLEEGQHVCAAAQYLEYADPMDRELRVRTVRRAIELKDSNSVVRALPGISFAGPAEDTAPGDLWPLFMEAVRFLAASEDTRWVHFVGARAKLKGIFKNRSEADIALLLDALRPLAKLDFRSEQILSAIAVDWPRLVIDHLADRVRRSRGSLPGYDALPNSFHYLKEVLRGEIDYLIATARTLHREDPTQYYFRRGNLVSNVFPEYGPELQAAFKKVIDGGDQLDLKVIAQMLPPYKGHLDIHELCKDIVAKAQDDSVLVDVEIALAPGGIFVGPFGVADAYQRLHERLKLWEADPREAVRVFASNLANDADLKAATERRRGQERLARLNLGD